MFETKCLSIEGLPSSALDGVKRLVCRPECSSASLVDAFLGSKKSRFGPLPSTENRDYLCQLLSRYTVMDIPVECMLLWGALKGYGLYDNRLCADIADVLAFRRLQNVDCEVRRHYKKGVHIQLVVEDVTEYLLSHEFHDVHYRISRYTTDIKRLSEMSELNIDVVLESKLYEAAGITVDEALKRSAVNGELLYLYWKESDGHSTPQELESYKRLQAQGWSGILPPAQREHYLRRAASEKPYFSQEDQIRSICLYFGNALARYQSKIRNGTISDAKGIIPTVKVSLAPYPDGVDQSLYRGRVEYKVKDSKNGNCAYTPWATIGFLSCSQEVDFIGLGMGAMRTNTPVHQEAFIDADGFKVRADQLIAA